MAFGLKYLFPWTRYLWAANRRKSTLELPHLTKLVNKKIPCDSYFELHLSEKKPSSLDTHEWKPMLWANLLEGDLILCKTKFTGVSPSLKSFVHAPQIAPDSLQNFGSQFPAGRQGFWAGLHKSHRTVSKTLDQFPACRQGFWAVVKGHVECRFCFWFLGIATLDNSATTCSVGGLSEEMALTVHFNFGPRTQQLLDSQYRLL